MIHHRRWFLIGLCEEDGGDGCEAEGDEGTSNGVGSTGEGCDWRASWAWWDDTLIIDD